jgi:hypothetical protein
LRRILLLNSRRSHIHSRTRTTSDDSMIDKAVRLSMSRPIATRLLLKPWLWLKPRRSIKIKRTRHMRIFEFEGCIAGCSVTAEAKDLLILISKKDKEDENPLFKDQQR